MTSAFSRCAPSVAYVDVFLESPSADGLRVRVPRGTGSGFVWDEQGRVVTNYHVVRGYVNPALPASASPAPPASPGPPSAALRKALLGNPVIEVTVGSQTLRASVVGFDVDKDIAVLQLPPFDPATRLPRAFPPIERLHGSFSQLGSEGAAVAPLPLLVGQTALAIGAPYGLSQSLSVGIISGLNRSFRSPSGRLVTGCIQTDCAVNPGNSGGPLLSSAGTLIGMTSAIESPTGASAGIAFAVPYDTLSYVVSLLIKYGKVTRPVLGATYLAAEKSEQIGIADGVLVVDVFKSSPAYAAGLRRTESGPGSGVARLGDVILSLDGERVRSEGELNQAIARKRVGDRVALAVRRQRPRKGGGGGVTDAGSDVVEIRTTLVGSTGSGGAKEAGSSLHGT
ncbi:hypothetical protein TeGR_g9935 [Tetraparma gracilis]|uniref:PDZ domain-containing protein n=1 Tax=Tetraparma gracilis TaxID=2962635 RepID=A0ABQ6M5I5_9STRA|nr:hypothetical protein TeGR_g9935 [Tetraparma gracilis]